MFKNFKISSKITSCVMVFIILMIFSWILTFYIWWTMKQRYNTMFCLYEIKEGILQLKTYEDEVFARKDVKKDILPIINQTLSLVSSYKDIPQMENINSLVQQQKNNLLDYNSYEKVNNKLITLINRMKNKSLKEISRCCLFLKILYFVLIFISLAVAGFFVKIMRKSLVAPLLKCKEYAERIANEDFSFRLEVDQNDEIGTVAKALNKLANSFQDRLLLSEGVIKNMSLPCSIIGKDLRVKMVNQSMLDLLKDDHTPEYWKGKIVGEMVYKDPKRITITQKCIETGKPQYHIEGALVRRDGEKVPVIVDSSPLYDHDGNIIGAFSTAFDITEIKEQQQKIMEQTKRLMKAAEDAEKVVERLSSSTEAISVQLSDSAKGAESQQRLVSETATAMEEMNSTALEIAKNAADATLSAEKSTKSAQEGSDVIQQTIHHISIVNERAQELNKDMEDLGERAEKIGDVIITISDIADQTNLLALNAAIEAARAGDAGKGFAVVADEVRKLAERTMSATKEVSATIRGIQDKSKQNISKTHEVIHTLEESVDMINRAGDLLKTIVDLAAETQQKITNIATAAEEQSSTSEEINRSVQEINQIAGETVQAMARCEQSINELVELAKLLRDIVRDLRA